jgi:hypothetical protein
MYLFHRELVREDARKIGSHGTTSESADLEERRNRLQIRINAFHQKAEAVFGGDIYDLCLTEDAELEGEGDDDGSDEEDRDDNEETDGIECPEKCQLSLPSSFKVEELARLGFQDIVNQEIDLRIGQANDCLEDLRQALGHKMVLFRTSMRSASGQKGKTRAWADVNRVDSKVQKHAKSYGLARRALINLGASQEILHKYQAIEKDDLKMSGDVVEENRVGQRNDKLAWFWKLGQGGEDRDNDNWLTECASSNFISMVTYSINCHSFPYYVVKD